MNVRSALMGLALASLITPLAALAQSGDDPFVWLEDVSGSRAMTWVNAENAKTLGVLKADPHFVTYLADALAAGNARDRIPQPAFINDRVYNYWQDAEHVRGIWRTTTIADYASAAPTWTTVLDLDALAKTEAKNWVWHGANCTSPSGTRCLISLSDGGEDASTIREFDLTTNQFVNGGFVLPRGKQNAAWLDADTILVAREWAPGELTASSYPYVVRSVKRGAPLAASSDVFRGSKSDVRVYPLAQIDGAGNRLVMIAQSPSFFENTYRLVTPNGLKPIAIPSKANVAALMDGKAIVRLNDAWTTPSGSFAAGSVVSLALSEIQADPQALKPLLVWTPGPREALAAIGATRGGLVMTTTDNVRGRAFILTPAADGTWTKRDLAVPDNAAVTLAASNRTGNEAFVTVTSFLTPTTMDAVDVRAATLAPSKTLAPKFDASLDVAEQREAISKDGTRVPYFIVHPKAMKRDGTNPTVLYAYGGFEISEVPTYSPTLGKLWLEHGGVYVLANIRGGGEFGPAWHEAGLKTQRQRIYDDFAAVARDLIAQNITSPRHLGIEGGSNGGLLMGVQFTQHPELWNAVDIQVPLLDMLRFEKIAAGASWVGEYGSVANPDERAFLASISPYNNIRSGVAYPRPLIWTTTKDDRVGPQHARKFAAKLGAMGIPYYFYEVVEGGHGAGANAQEQAFTEALEYTYFTRQLAR